MRGGEDSTGGLPRWLPEVVSMPVDTATPLLALPEYCTIHLALPCLQGAEKSRTMGSERKEDRLFWD